MKAKKILAGILAASTAVSLAACNIINIRQYIIFIKDRR